MLTDYHASDHSFAKLVDFHYRFEAIHPFQDGSGRTGRLLLFKECLAAGIIPFIIADDKKQFYYRGLRAYETEPGYLRETCGEAQDNYLLLCCQLIRGFREEAEKENLIRTELLRILDRKK
jgi:Fic family protein